jgi:hypothetical protein
MSKKPIVKIKPVISPGAVGMARKMIRTIFPQHDMSRQDRQELLNRITVVALDDLTSRGMLEWKAAPPATARLRFARQGILLVQDRRGGYLKKTYEESEITAHLDRVEVLLEQYGLDEIERATLFTALPCLGLEALQADFLSWERDPPFAELN